MSPAYQILSGPIFAGFAFRPFGFPAAPTLAEAFRRISHRVPVELFPDMPVCSSVAAVVPRYWSLGDEANLPAPRAFAAREEGLREGVIGIGHQGSNAQWSGPVEDDLRCSSGNAVRYRMGRRL
ncbi:protein of unknown function [Streptantibioticus cattleyicolor NRRL 8057 = DSM 46488]|nr:protein of unknown function [Streptantibioticus cattleyicolor NRRL 8057 = DSM 46488]